MDQDARNRVKIVSVEVLKDDWSKVKKTTFDYQRSDGKWQRQVRETYNRGDGVAILLFNRKTRNVVLVRQFRYPAFERGEAGFLIEVPAGAMDDDMNPDEKMLHEVREETGFEVEKVQKILECFMSPGSVTEKLHYYIAEYEPSEKAEQGGGIPSEGEDIEVLEIPLERALEMVKTGEIEDGKTILLLQYAKLNLMP